MNQLGRADINTARAQPPRSAGSTHYSTGDAPTVTQRQRGSRPSARPRSFPTDLTPRGSRAASRCGPTSGDALALRPGPSGAARVSLQLRAHMHRHTEHSGIDVAGYEPSGAARWIRSGGAGRDRGTAGPTSTSSSSSLTCGARARPPESQRRARAPAALRPPPWRGKPPPAGGARARDQCANIEKGAAAIFEDFPAAD